MSHYHAQSLIHNEKLINKKVLIYTHGKSTIGILKKVEHVIYGIKPIYVIIVDDVIVKTEGILIPFSLTIEHDIKVSPELCTEHFIFEPFNFSDF